jgi:hypothetical protein
MKSLILAKQRALMEYIPIVSANVLRRCRIALRLAIFCQNVNNRNNFLNIYKQEMTAYYFGIQSKDQCQMACT